MAFLSVSFIFKFTRSAAIHDHAAVLGCTVDTVRKSAIDWFHGARDGYGGREKRSNNSTKEPATDTDAYAQ
nr:unnamed protein product [Spirometra erinaceieuropaei]